jgi:hypothetical protein
MTLPVGHVNCAELPSGTACAVVADKKQQVTASGDAWQEAGCLARGIPDGEAELAVAKEHILVHLKQAAGAVGPQTPVHTLKCD